MKALKGDLVAIIDRDMKELGVYTLNFAVKSGQGKRTLEKARKIREALPDLFQQGVDYGHRNFHLDIVYYTVGYPSIDIDNMLKFTLDAIKYKIIPDDKFVQSLTAKIAFAKEGIPSIEIKVSEIIN